MPNPHLDGASFPKLTKTGTSNGTVTGTTIANGNPVSIATKNGKKTWEGTVGDPTSTANTWSASVTNKTWNEEGPGPRGPETVTVVVSNSTGPSNGVDTTSDIP